MCRAKFSSDQPFQIEITSDQNFKIKINSDQTFQTDWVTDQTFQTEITSNQTFQIEITSDQTLQIKRFLIRPSPEHVPDSNLDNFPDLNQTMMSRLSLDHLPSWPLIKNSQNPQSTPHKPPSNTPQHSHFHPPPPIDLNSPLT